jgi:sugar lactone lactonase YvrE
MNSQNARRISLATALLTTIAAGLGTVAVGNVTQVQIPTISTYAGGGTIVNAPALQFGIALPVATVVASDSSLYFTNGYSIYHYLPAAGTMSLIAGNGFPGPSSNGSAALAAEFGFAAGLALDAGGNLFVADAGNNVISRIDALSGTITTIVGTAGTPGYTGDGGPASAATLNGPAGVFVDAAGDLFIADTGNNVVRVVAQSTGSIATVAGNGTAGYAGDGGLATAAGAELNQPVRAVLDSAGNLLIVDSNNSAIRRVDTTGNLTTVAGNGTPGYSGDSGLASAAELDQPNDIAIDASGDLYVADTGNNVIRFVAASAGNITSTSVITTIVGTGTAGYTGDGGPPASAELSSPLGVSIDKMGAIFIADATNGVIREVSVAGSIATVAGNGSISFGGDTGPASAAELASPSGVIADGSGNLFVADTLNHSIRRIDAVSGVITTIAGVGQPGYSGDGGAATSAELDSPAAVALDAAGDLFIADTGNCVIRRVDATGILAGVIMTVAGNGSCGYDVDGVPATSAGLGNPQGLALDAAGDLFIADTDDNRIRRVDASSRLIATVIGDGNAAYTGDSGPATAAEVNQPTGVLVDSSGDLYVVDNGNNVIRFVSAATGVITTRVGNGTSGFSGDGGPAGSAELSAPAGAAFDSAGNLFIADTDNDVVRRVDAASGNISTVAGDTNYGFSGDGGAATSATLAQPAGVAFDAAGNLYVADSSNNRVRLVVGSGVGSAPPPVVASLVRGTQGANGWYTSNVSVSWSVTDAYAPITSSSGCGPTSITIDTPGQVVTCTATSGGTTTASVTIQREATLPKLSTSIAPPPNAAGWNTTTPVTVGFAATALSGIPANGCTPPIKIVANGANQQVNGSCTDTAGNRSAATVTLNVDTLAPTVTITAPANGASYAEGAQLTANYACNDVISGISGCLGSVPNNAPINTTSSGPQSFTVTATDVAGNVTSNTVNYTVGAPQTSFSLNPSALSFPTEEPAQKSPTQAITLRNLGNTPLVLKLLKISNGGAYSDDFTQTNNCGVSVPIGGSCTINIAFTPISAGQKSDSLLVTVFGAASQSAALSGLAIPPPYAVSPSAVTFAAQAAGIASAPLPLTITNTGALPLVWRGVSLSGASPTDFLAASACPSSISVGASCSIALRFTPPSSGMKTAVLTLNVGGGAVPRKIDLSGLGIVPLYSVGPTTLAFGNQAMGTASVPKILTLSNTGSLPVPITSIGLSGASPGDFKETNNCGSAIAFAGSCQINVSFTPPSKGAKSATLKIVAGGDAGTKNVALSGNGVAGVLP